jgi:hypothetical protein
MDGHAIARRRQPFCLINDRFGVFVTQQDERNFCHLD